MPSDSFLPTGGRFAAAVNPGEVSLVTGSLVSIIIPCCGMRDYTNLCVPSVLKHSRPPFELIFLDIGSLDGTADYLEGIAAASPDIRVEIVRTATDLGIKDAAKDAIGRARGQYLLLLNNDTIVTHLYLQQLIALADMSPAIGAVGPVSNFAAPPQLVECVPYRIGARTRKKKGAARPVAGLVDVEAMNKFATEYREKNKGQWLQSDRLGGFCLLIKRETLERMGPLDPWTDLSLFDSDILSSKAKQAGYTLACCRDLFIHHFGVRTFAHGAPGDLDKDKNPAVALR